MLPPLPLRPSLLLLAANLAFLAPVALAFDGTVVVKTVHGADPSKALVFTECVFSFKGEFLRNETHLRPTKDPKNPLSSYIVIHNPAKEEKYHVRKLPIPSKKAAWVYDVQPLNPAANPDATQTASQPQISFAATGRKSRIAGHEAAEYLWEDGPSRIELWATQALGPVDMTKDPVFRKDGWPQFVLANNLAMLRVRVVKPAHVPTFTEVVKVEKVAHPDSHFLPPADAVRAKEKSEMMPILDKQPKKQAPAGEPAKAG